MEFYFTHPAGRFIFDALSIKQERARQTLTNLILISSTFFGYHDRIRIALERRGYNVIFVNENINDHFLVKIFIRFLLRYVKLIFFPYYWWRITRLKWDLRKTEVLVIKGETLPEKFLIWLKAKGVPKIVFYNWDSVSNNPGSDRFIGLADFFFTFDSNDAAAYGVSYLQLFHEVEPDSKKRLPLAKSGSQLSLDRAPSIVFIGSSHSHRREVLSRLCDKLRGRDIDVFIYIVAKSVLFYAAEFLLYAFRGDCVLALKALHSTPMKYASYKVKIANADAIIDIARPNQTGLTMRSIEVLAAGSKLITDNSHICYENFYDPDYIFILKENCMELDAENLHEFLIRKPARQAPDMKSLHVDRWLGALGF